MGNENLKAAREAKNDEFYTRLEDVAAEVEHHKEAFRGACVYCNCDDPRRSQVWAYFRENYNDLGLRGLIATGYSEYGFGVFGIYCGDDRPDAGMYGRIDAGDYKSPAALRFLSVADIVVTNPPFSQMREYVQFLHEHDKRFLIIAPAHVLKAKGVIDLMADGVFVCGKTRPSQFLTPGGEIRRMGNTTWLNGLRDGVFPDALKLCRRYDPSRYHAFDNYAALSVDRLEDIPIDYPGIVGLPVTILQAFRPDQYELIGADEASGKGASRGLYTGGSPDRHAHVQGVRKFTRVFVRLK